MADHVLTREQRLPGPPAAVFPFFADALNLERITPRWLRFRVVTPAPIEMRPGALIEYRLRLHGLPVRWLTEIEAWEPPHRFVDRQLRGPYRSWWHEHTFASDGEGGTTMRDLVRYSLPLGPLGRLADVALVRGDLRRIFDHRAAAVAAAIAS
jgi:ligand-binding SRPBCC domain-containing protein